jgi:cytochrome bd-type quinol oxidase subunit 2
MSTLLWLVLVFFLTGYLVLDGFDFGVGMTMGRGTPERRDRLARRISPLFLGNEVWGVAAVGVLIGAFPSTESIQSPRLYPFVVAILLSWMARDAGLWFRSRTRGDWCDPLIAAASAVLTFSWGYVLTDIAVGGLAAIAVALLHGRAFLAGRRYALATAVGLAAAVALPLLINRPDVAAGSTTLELLAVFVLPALPLLLAAQVWLWRLCRRPADAPGFF